MKRLFILFVILTLVFALASCNGSSDTTDGADTDVTTYVGDTEPPVLEVGVVSNVVFTPGDYSGTLEWSAFVGAESYDVYMKYSDSVLDMHVVAEGVTDTTVTLALDYGRHTAFKIVANGKWRGEDAVLAESEIIEGKSNGIRANEFATHDNIMKYLAPKVSHEGLGILWINGEIWISDGGAVNNRTIEALDDLRMELLRDTGYLRDSSCKLAVNIYITHYHGDHVSALIKSIIPSMYLAIEDIYSPANAEQEMVRDPNFERVQNALKQYRTGTNYRFIEVPYGEKLELPFENSTAKVTFYSAVQDWSVICYTDDGQIDTTTGWGYMLVAKGMNNAITLAQNCNSMWAVYEFENTSVLFTGDTYHNDQNVIIPMLEYYGRENFDVDILVYLHHGSIRFSVEIYDVCTPEYVVYNSYMLDEGAVGYANKQGIKTYWAYIKPFTATLDGENITMDRAPDVIE